MSENPADFEGEQIVLTGEIIDESGFEEIGIMAEEVEYIGEETAEAFRSNKEIGSVDGSIDFAGCEVSEFASEVTVEGTIESYERCDCKPDVTEEDVREAESSIQAREIYENITYNEEEVGTENTFAGYCESDTEMRFTFRSEERPTASVAREMETMGCEENTTETRYYFKCTEILEEHN